MHGDSNRRAAELHELAAHAHRAAAAHHDKQDHPTAHELTRKAHEHAERAFEASRDAHRESTGEPEP